MGDKRCLIACDLTLVLSLLIHNSGAQGDAPLTFKSEEYFPLSSGQEWTYNENGAAMITRRVLEGTFLVNGVSTRIFQSIEDPSGEVFDSYFTNDGNELRLHREAGIVDGINVDITLSPAVTLLENHFSVGQEVVSQGTATMAITGRGTFPLSYTFTSKVLSIEPVTVPLGTFDTVKIEDSLTLTGNVSGQPVTIAGVDTTWLSRFVGVVKEKAEVEGETTTRELTALSPPITGSLLVTITQDSAINNGAQWKITNDSIGFDSGFNNSGVELSNISVGNYTLEFKDIPGWTQR